MAPLLLDVPGRKSALQVRVSTAVSGDRLPVIVFAHGFGSSMAGYAPLVDFWASHGFVVIQPTFMDSTALSDNPSASHNEAVKAYLDNPQKHEMWRYRVQDVECILDQLRFIEDSVPTLKGRLDSAKIAAVGHSFGAQTAAVLLGARVLGLNGEAGEDLSDSRIKAGVLLCGGGRGGNALSPFAAEHFPHLNQSYSQLQTRTLVVAGDHDNSPLTVTGPDWFTDAYTLSPGADCLMTCFGGEHMLGGISGYKVTETTDENPERVKMVQKYTTAYLRRTLLAEEKTWNDALTELKGESYPLIKIENRCANEVRGR